MSARPESLAEEAARVLGRGYPLSAEGADALLAERTALLAEVAELRTFKVNAKQSYEDLGRRTTALEVALALAATRLSDASIHMKVSTDGDLMRRWSAEARSSLDGAK